MSVTAAKASVALETHPERSPFRHIACCIDRSAASELALAEALRLARLCEARLSAVHVARAPMAGYNRWEPEAQPFFHEAEAWLRGRVADLPGVEPVTLWGFAPERVTDWARENGVDLLVAAAHRGAARRAVLGSFTANLARHAPCPVLAVRPPEEPETPADGHVMAMADTDGILRSDGGRPVRTGGTWRGERLLLGAVARSALDELRHAAAEEGRSVVGDATASAVYESAEGERPGLREIVCEIHATLRPPPSAAVAARLAEQAERACAIAGTLVVAPRFRWYVNGRHIALSESEERPS